MLLSLFSVDFGLGFTHDSDSPSKVVRTLFRFARTESAGAPEKEHRRVLWTCPRLDSLTAFLLSPSTSFYMYCCGFLFFFFYFVYLFIRTSPQLVLVCSPLLFSFMQNEIQLADSISIIQLTFIDPIPLLVFLLHEYFSFSFYWLSVRQRLLANCDIS